MTATVPVPDKSPGDLLTTTLWNVHVAANLNKLLNQGHRKVTVAQFAALTGIEDGDEVYLEVDSTNGIEWHLVYRDAEATYKWRFLGGPPMKSEVFTFETTASTTYAALATAGPSIALPRAGDYDVRVASNLRNDTDTRYTLHSYDIGVTGALDDDGADYTRGTGASNTTVTAERRKTGLTAVSLVSKYRVNAGTGTAGRRRMAVYPVRLRHDA